MIGASLILFVAACQSVDQSRIGPTYKAQVLRANLVAVKPGMSMEACARVMGEPTYVTKLSPKERVQTIATHFYYVVRQRDAFINPTKDEYVRLTFDRFGKLEHVEKNNLSR